MAGPTTLIPDLMQSQIGKETVWGTSVTPTAKLALIEECTITPEVEASVLPEQKGSIDPGSQEALLKSSGSAKVSGIATYEDLPYWLNSLLGEVTQVGGTYTPIAPLSGTPDRRKMTLVSGMTGGIYKLAGGIVNELTLSCEAGSPMKFEASLIGKSVSTVTLEALSDRTVYPILSPQMKIYLDAWDGAIGTTELTGITWFSYELSLKSNAALVFGVGSLNPVMYRDAKYEGSLKLALEFNATSKGYLDTIVGSGLFQKLIELRATDNSRICKLQFAGGAVKAPEISTDTDGVATLEFELAAVYNSPLANWFKAPITNAVAILP
jgi:hypothetical protein